MNGFLSFLVSGWFLLAVVYLVLAPVFFLSWLKFYQLDLPAEAEERLFSWIVLGVATLFWPLVVPVAYLKLLRQRRQEREALAILETAQHPPEQTSSQSIKPKQSSETQRH